MLNLNFLSCNCFRDGLRSPEFYDPNLPQPQQMFANPLALLVQAFHECLDSRRRPPTAMAAPTTPEAVATAAPTTPEAVTERDAAVAELKDLLEMSESDRDRAVTERDAAVTSDDGADVTSDAPTTPEAVTSDAPSDDDDLKKVQQLIDEVEWYGDSMAPAEADLRMARAKITPTTPSDDDDLEEVQRLIIEVKEYKDGKAKAEADLRTACAAIFAT